MYHVEFYPSHTMDKYTFEHTYKAASLPRIYEVTSPITGHSWKVILTHTLLRLIKTDKEPVFVRLAVYLSLKNQTYPKRVAKARPSVLYDDYRAIDVPLPVLCGSSTSSVVVVEVHLDCVQITQTLKWEDILLSADTWAHPTKHQSARMVWMLRDTNEYVHQSELHPSPREFTKKKAGGRLVK